ncbi:hypothetical protein [Paludisphaera sp.]|uniref:hypothetical protein n=1 Tax=Paludisphaera sp. TaxID=2017432 RepID=UPI00301CD15A
MSTTDRSAKRRNRFRLESLEDRSLMSVLINAKPTLEVIPQGNRVREMRGAIYLTQPTPIAVTGTTQPPTSGVQVLVQIFAKDANGNLVNGGAPLASATPDFSGQYTATLSLPSRLRADVNTLFARVTAVGSLVSNVQINPTTLSGLTGDLTVDGTTLRDLTATINNPATTGTLTGGFVTPATPITGIGGTITTPAFPIDTPGGPGTAGPAVSTLLGGTGTLDPQVGTIVGGAINSPGSTSTLTDGTGAIDPTTGAFTQTGTAAIAATTGTSTLNISEVAVSEPITIVVHQSRPGPGSTIPVRSQEQFARGEAGSRIHGRPTGPRALAARALAGRGRPS